MRLKLEREAHDREVQELQQELRLLRKEVRKQDRELQALQPASDPVTGEDTLEGRLLRTIVLC